LLQAAVRMHRQPSTTATPFVGWQGVQSKLTAGESAVEFVHFKYQGIDTALEGDTLYAAFILLPDNQPPRFVPICRQSELAQLLNPGTGASEESIVKGLYGGKQDFYQLLWMPLAPFLSTAHTIYYAPSGLLHRVNPAALMDSKGHILANTWVRLQNIRSLVAHHLADQSFAKISGQSGEQTAVVFGGIRYDMDSTAYLHLCAEMNRGPKPKFFSSHRVRFSESADRGI